MQKNHHKCEFRLRMTIKGIKRKDYEKLKRLCCKWPLNKAFFQCLFTQSLSRGTQIKSFLRLKTHEDPAGVDSTLSTVDAATLSHCLTRFRLDKPSPIPTGPTETLNVSLKGSRLERFTFVSELCRGKAARGRKQEWKEEGGFQNTVSGTNRRGCWSSTEFYNCMD